MELKTLKAGEISQMRDLTLKSQPLRKEISLRDIKIVNRQMLEINGSRVTCSPDAMKSLLRILGLSKDFIGRFTNLFSEENGNRLINRIREALAQQDGTKIWISANPSSKTITGIGRQYGNRMSAGQFIPFAEDLVGDSGMQITNWAVSNDGNVEINAFNPNGWVDIPFDGADGGSEVFTGGLNISLNATDVQVKPYINRQWCSNGMVTSMAQERFVLNSLDSVTLDKFHQELELLKERNWIPASLPELVNSSSKTAASLAELQRTHLKCQNIVSDNADRWVPLNTNMQAYRRAGLKPDEMSSEQLAKAKSNTSIWDLTNALTHLATHGKDLVQSWDDYKGARMMVNAGELLASKWHHKDEVLNPFNELVPSGSLLN